MNRTLLTKANVLRSLFFIPLAIALFACAEQSATSPAPQPSPTTKVVVVVATNPPVTATKVSTATVAPTNTAAATSTTEPTQQVVPTQVPPTAIPPTKIPPTAVPQATLPSPTLAPPTEALPPPTDQPTAEPPAVPTEAPTANPQPVAPPASFAPTEMVFVGGGVLKMGGKAPEDDPDEKPFHDADIYDFNIEKYEVTNAQYQACVAAGVCPAPTKRGSGTRATYFGDPAFDTYPVVNVTWYGADAYCKWNGRRLPNEGEWERAAKGVENWRYTWSNSIGMHFEWNAIFHGSPISFCEASCGLSTYWTDVNDGFPDTAPVGRFSEYDTSSGFGVIDMAGNVAEWTNNWYDGNAYINGNDIYGPSEPTGVKTVRGGSWADEPRRNSDREPQAPEYSSDRIGFRCAR